MRLSYIIIPVGAIITALVGSAFTSGGMDWYKTIRLPVITPPGSVIGIVWTIIFILSAISAIIVWNKSLHDNYVWLIMLLFGTNALLNVIWSWIFFSLHYVGAAAFEAIILEISVILLIVAIWPISRLAAALLFPYAVWVAFATYLTFTIWSLNR